MRSSQIIRLFIFTSLATGSVFGAATQKSQATVQAVPGDTLITLERTRCYGMCPSYKITISAGGDVTFEGRHFVKEVGLVKSTISQERLRELLAAFERISYFALRNQYEDDADGCKGIVTDHPSAITSIRVNGKSKAINHYHGCRGVEVLAELTKLEQAIDDAVNSTQWIR